MTLTQELARFVEHPPTQARVRRAAVRCVVDWAGCALAGSRHEIAVVLERVMPLFGKGDDSTLVGRVERTTPMGAAFFNGSAAHVLDFDDVNVTMIGHPGVVVIPAVLAIAEQRGLSGEKLLDAVTGGYQVCAELGALVNPEHYERGWHATGTIGAISAAAAATACLGGDASAIERAISLGATQASGLRVMFGSHGKAIHAGRAAASGVLAAVLAMARADIPSDALEGNTGWFAVAAGPIDRDRLTAVRAAEAAILDTAYKRHAACGATHCLIDAVHELVLEHRLAPDDIEAIDAKVHPLALTAAGIETPRTGLEAKFSLKHTAALAAIRYPLGPGAFEDACFEPAAAIALRSRVSIEADDKMRYDEAMPADVVIRTRDGALHRRRVEAPRGRPRNPMSDAELDAKFLELAGDRGDILTALRSLPTTPDVRPVARRLGA